MKTASTILLIASALAALAAIWAPGAWWQWLATAVILLFAAAGTGSAADKQSRRSENPALMPDSIADEVFGTSDTTQRTPNKPTYGKPSDKEHP